MPIITKVKIDSYNIGFEMELMSLTPTFFESELTPERIVNALVGRMVDIHDTLTITFRGKDYEFRMYRFTRYLYSHEHPNQPPDIAQVRVVPISNANTTIKILSRESWKDNSWLDVRLKEKEKMYGPGQ